MITGIILAAGEGSRLKLPDRNKTTLDIENKPLVQYGVELFQSLVQQTIIVVGAYADTVKASVQGENILFTEQLERKGTGHATQVAVEAIEASGQTPTEVLVGYGDHMMFYTPEILQQLLDLHREKQAAVSMIAAEHHDPNSLAWGRIVRDHQGYVAAIVEQKDATPQQRQITELNAGLYCFDYAFLQKNIRNLVPSAVSGELYVTDLIEIARTQGLPVCALTVPFEYVGIGINTTEHLEQAKALLAQRRS